MYTLSLTNVFWSENDIDTRYFSGVSDQRQYFLNLTQGIEQPLRKVPINNNINMTVVYFDETGRSITEILGTNYAVLREYENEILVDERYYFASSRQLVGNQIEVSLTLDDVQTNYFKCKNDIQICTIDRACLPRFLKDGNNFVFDNSPTSQLLTSENIALPKRLLSRTAITPNIDYIENSPLNNALKGVYWLVAYISNSDEVNQILGINKPQPFQPASNLSPQYYVFVFPINSNKIYIGNETNKIDISSFAFELFVQSTKLSPYIIGYKISPICPFNVQNYILNDDYFVDTDGNIIFNTTKSTFPANSLGNFQGKRVKYDNNSEIGIISMLRQSDNSSFYDYEITRQTRFTKDEIVGQEKNYKFNPKLLSSPYYELNIVDYYGNSFSYDVQKINSNKIRLLFSESITPENTKGYVRIQDNADSVYNNGSDKNLTGLVYSNDTSVTYGIDGLSQFLANNRNFSMIQQATRDYNAQMTQLGINKQLLSLGLQGGSTLLTGGDVSKFAGNMARTGADIIFADATLQAQNDFNKLQESFTLDNMRGAPTAYHNAQGNIVLPLIINDELSFYIEEYSGIEQDLETVNDYTHLYGYNYKRSGYVKDYDNIRSLFNYVSADVGLITSPISNEEKNRLRARLKGIRFWNSDTIDFITDNTENEVLNG